MKTYRSLWLSIIFICAFLPATHAEQATSYVIEPQYEMVQPFSEGLATLFVNEQWGYMDKTGKEIIKPQYNFALPFSEGLAAVSTEDGWGFIDKTGKFVIKPQFDAIDFQPDFNGGFSEGLASVSINDKWGFIDKTGTIVVDPQFDYALSFSEGLAAVYSDGLFGYIDKTGNYVIDPIYDEARPFSEGIASVYYFDGWGFIDKTGEAFTGFIYSDPSQFKEGLAPVDDGFINTDGQLVIDFLSDKYYDKADSFHDGIALVYKIMQREFYYGFMDKDENEIVAPQYPYNRPVQFSKGLAAIIVDDQWGFIDKTGKVVIPPQFEDIMGDFSEGLVGVSVDGKWGFINASFTSSPTKPSTTSPTVNEKPSSWAVEEVDAAMSFDLVPAKMQTKYNDNMNREEFSELIVNLFSVVADMTVDEWIASMENDMPKNVFRDTEDAKVLAAYSLGIVNGKGNGIFDPKGEITRQEAAVMLQRAALQLGTSATLHSTPYADKGTIADWAIDAVMFVAALEDKSVDRVVMGGVSNNKFDPIGKYTREQAFITIKRLYFANLN